MAVSKLSAIASGGAVAGATDTVVAVRSGTTDVLVTPVALDAAQAWTGQQTFGTSAIIASFGVVTPKIYPASDSTTAIQILKADAITSVLVVDTSNGRIGIGVTPTAPLHIYGSTASVAPALWVSDSNATLGAALYFEYRGGAVSNKIHAFVADSNGLNFFRITDAGNAFVSSTADLTVSSSGLIGIHKPTAIGAQLHVVAKDATTLGGIFEGWLQNKSARSRLTADATKTDTTFANLTDLSLTLLAGRKYTGRLIIKCNNSAAAEGIKFDFNGGSATMTSFWASASESAGGTTVLGTAISTSLAGVINYTTITGETVIEFSISLVCNAAGTFIPRFAENSTAAGTATVELGSFLWLEDSPN